MRCQEVNPLGKIKNIKTTLKPAYFNLNQAALDLLARHAEQFDSFIYEDYKELFERISQWAQHKNYDMKKLGYIALDSYYKQVCCFYFIINNE